MRRLHYTITYTLLMEETHYLRILHSSSRFLRARGKAIQQRKRTHSRRGVSLYFVNVLVGSCFDAYILYITHIRPHSVMTGRYFDSFFISIYPLDLKLQLLKAQADEQIDPRASEVRAMQLRRSRCSNTDRPP